MNFPENASGKRHHFQRLKQAIKYFIVKTDVVDEKSMAHMKHKPYSCDFKMEKKECE